VVGVVGRSPAGGCRYLRCEIVYNTIMLGDKFIGGFCGYERDFTSTFLPVFIWRGKVRARSA
jgi:hypothetical protein